jgi:hypothetical protein
MKRSYGVDEVSKTAAKPIKSPDNQDIAVSQVAESLCKPFAFSFDTRDMIGEDLI